MSFKIVQIRVREVLMITGLLLAYACGSSSEQNNTSYEAPQTNTEIVEPTLNIKDISNSKGIGKFTSIPVEPINSSMAKKGGLLFTLKCAGCHTLSGNKIVGPGLKGVTRIRTPEWILNIITNPEEMTKKDPMARALMDEYLVQMTFQGVTDQEAKELLEYLRQNDTPQ